MNFGVIIRPIARALGVAPGFVQIGSLTLAYIGWLQMAPRYSVIEDIVWIGIAVVVVLVSRLLNKDWYLPPTKL